MGGEPPRRKLFCADRCAVMGWRACTTRGARDIETVHVIKSSQGVTGIFKLLCKSSLLLESGYTCQPLWRKESSSSRGVGFGLSGQNLALCPAAFLLLVVPSFLQLMWSHALPLCVPDCCHHSRFLEWRWLCSKDASEARGGVHRVGGAVAGSLQHVNTGKPGVYQAMQNSDFKEQD